MNKTMWAIQFINVKGETMLVTKDGVPATLDDMPLFKSMANAEKAVKFIMYMLGDAQDTIHSRVHNGIRAGKYGCADELWKDAASQKYFDQLLMVSEGLKIVKVSITSHA